VADEKTRVLTAVEAVEAAGLAVEPPQFIDGKIVFFCPNGHRLVVADVHAGKRGRCDKAGCGVPVVIPTPPRVEQAGFAGIATALDGPAADESAGPEAEADEAGRDAELSAVEEQEAPAGEPADAAVDWQSSAGVEAVAGEEPVPAAAWNGFDSVEPEGEAADNPTARLVARLWVERNHGGVVELHLSSGSVILPEWYESRWSRGTHGLFASQAADGSITLTAVAWEAIQKVVVRQVQGLPDGMFE
jgi:hypothetical protein